MKKSFEVFTKEWLESQNITVEGNDVYHETPYKGKVKLTPALNVKHHKYGKDMEYYLVGWYSRQDHRQYSFTLQRILYAWYVGPIERGMDIDHVNNKPLDNRIENLQKLTHKENLAKRTGARNQYIAMKNQGMSKKAQDDYWDECERVAR